MLIQANLDIHFAPDLDEETETVVAADGINQAFAAINRGKYLVDILKKHKTDQLEILSINIMSPFMLAFTIR